jgi:hypothetical protein
VTNFDDAFPNYVSNSDIVAFPLLIKFYSYRLLIIEGTSQSFRNSQKEIGGRPWQDYVEILHKAG